jgi:DNA-binding response OmpR family regulator
MTADPPRVVAILDSDPDTTEMLQVALEAAHFVVATGSLHEFRSGTEDLFAFLDRTRPDVILYDLSPPYEANWAFLQRARQNPTFARCGLVITTTNKRAVEKLVSLPVVEIFGKPYDLDVLTTAVRTATAPPSTVDSDDDRRLGRDRRIGDDRRSGNDRRDGGRVQ